MGYSHFTSIRYPDLSHESPLLVLLMSSATPGRLAHFPSFVFFALLSFPAEVKWIRIIIFVIIVTIVVIETVIIVNAAGTGAAATCSQQSCEGNQDKFSSHVILLRQSSPLFPSSSPIVEQLLSKE
jgi:hypothetical protein